MKKGKITVCIIACFALATVMSMQFKIVKQTDITSIETMRKEELRTEIANLKQKYKEAQEQYEDKVNKLSEYMKEQKSKDESSKLVEDEYSKTEMYLGKTNVQGQGIVITIKNTANSDTDSITAEDLLIIIDYLKFGGAEAISINEERITGMSEVVYVNNSIVFVNQQRILAPYVIKAIGDQSKLESTLFGNGGYLEILKNYRF